CKVAGKYQQSSPPYPSKPNLLEAFDELLRTARESDLPAEVYHIKTPGKKKSFSLCRFSIFLTLPLQLALAGVTDLSKTHPPLTCGFSRANDLDCRLRTATTGNVSLRVRMKS